jgi:hypothetical protein
MMSCLLLFFNHQPRAFFNHIVATYERTLAAPELRGPSPAGFILWLKITAVSSAARVFRDNLTLFVFTFDNFWNDITFFFLKKQ